MESWWLNDWEMWHWWLLRCNSDHFSLVSDSGWRTKFSFTMTKCEKRLRLGGHSGVVFGAACSIGRSELSAVYSLRNDRGTPQSSRCTNCLRSRRWSSSSPWVNCIIDMRRRWWRWHWNKSREMNELAGLTSEQEIRRCWSGFLSFNPTESQAPSIFQLYRTQNRPKHRPKSRIGKIKRNCEIFDRESQTVEWLAS
jgi:hypothetical protein